MNSGRLIRNNLVYYWKKNLLLAAGIAISAAVLTGALIVGDSVRYSLNRIVELRLGQVTHVFRGGDRYFSVGLSEKTGSGTGAATAPVLLEEGVAIAAGGQRRINYVQVMGVDASFDRMAGTGNYFGSISGDTIVISQNLADRLVVAPGDEILLRIRRASLIPANAPFVSEEGNTVTLRAVIREIAGDDRLGKFNLKVSQTAPFNVFMDRSRLERLMDFAGMANVMLIDAVGAGNDPGIPGTGWKGNDPGIPGAGGEADREGIMDVIRESLSPQDAALAIHRKDAALAIRRKASALAIHQKDAALAIRRKDAAQASQRPETAGYTGITSERVFIDDAISGFLLEKYPSARGYVTYFVNGLNSKNGTTPYSFVSTLPGGSLREDEIIINRWLAEDLSAGVGDTVGITYFVVGPLRKLVEDSARFAVKEVVPIAGRYADRDLMPDIPGLSDAGNCRDWETGVPIDLESIRDKDEDYWDRYGGTPKAFISVDRGVAMWKNRFGTYTTIRIGSEDTGPVSPGTAGNSTQSGNPAGSPGDSDDPAPAVASADLLDGFNPALLGFTVEAVRSRGYEAAGSGVDFTQLFAGLSFFLLVAGILLTVLLFLLNLESRKEQLKTLVVMGIPLKLVRRIMLGEAMAVAAVGALIGLVLSVLYNRLVFAALNGVWREIVRTEMMQIEIRTVTLLAGFGLTLAIAFLALVFPLRRMLRKQERAHLGKEGRMQKITAGNKNRRRAWAVLSVVPGLTALGLIAWQISLSEVVNVPVFFAAGGFLLVSAIFFFLWYLDRISMGTGKEFSLQMLSWKNALRNRTRSMSIVILFAIGAFLVISTGSNRRDLFRNAGEPSSGTGGFLYYAESTVPVLRDLNDPAVRFEYGFSGDDSSDGSETVPGERYTIVQFRKAEGDDASCLNLNRVVSPRILGVDPGRLEGRFSFVTRTGYLDEGQPWISLQQELPGGLIPAIADETVIKWGFGMKVGDTLEYVNSQGETMQLLLIGGLAPSIFQGSVIISGENFLEQFPASSGTSVFLVDGALADTATIRTEMDRAFRDLGWDMELTAARLAEFNSVTNTYLSIFMVMGALGLLVGTFGLAVVLFRSILERRQEIALLKAVGFGRKRIRRMVTREYMLLLLIGIGSGFATAIIATLPSILSANTGTSFTSILAWLAVLVLNGWIWIRLISWSALRNRAIYTALRNE